jgi:hypothetical protein
MDGDLVYHKADYYHYPIDDIRSIVTVPVAVPLVPIVRIGNAIRS